MPPTTVSRSWDLPLLHVPQHPDQHRPKRPVLLAVVQKVVHASRPTDRLRFQVGAECTRMVVVKSSGVRGRQPADLMRAAARNNAEWCDRVCRLHGQAGTYHDGGWTVPRRSPPLYPDAITLDPAATIDAILAAIDTSPGCSLKDSFACLDLASEGFHVLFEAQWICRDTNAASPEAPTGMRWERVRAPAVLRQWERAWNQYDVEIPAGLFHPSLLDEDAVIVMAGYRDEAIVAGAISNRSTTVASVTNVFSAIGDLDAAWRASLAALATLVGALPLVGYERGVDLEVARRYGFAPLGPLRVWIK